MDDISTSTLFIILGLLVLFSAYFSGSETGIMSINRIRLRHLAKEEHRAAKRVSKLLSRPDRLIGLILIGNNLVNIAAAQVATIIGIRLYGDLGIGIATGVLTLVVLIFAEVTPKTLAALYPEKVAFPSSIILKGLLKILFPFVVVVNWMTNGILRLFGISSAQIDEHSMSKEELKTVVNESGALLPARHQSMLTSILDLEQVTVEDIMIPRNEIVAIDINDDWKLISRQLTHAQHTRVLLYRDNIDDAVGFIHSRDALRLLTKEQFDKPSLLRAVREIYFIPEGTSLNTQLLKFQQSKERIGIVVDEYGDIQGLVTLEDILEEVVGDFTTTQTRTPSEEVTTQSDGSYLVDGGANVRDLNKEMGWEFPLDGPKTLSGLIVEYLEDIPDANLSLKIAGYPVEVLKVKENMIKQVKIKPNQRKL
ncbi:MULTISPECIES: HlyC/CorC family transporter [unclassified Pseudoalteromonas]|uniref:HlyC/CorC family transporter n=1 Tax=unclassified Pseudoalteromonas TaxID=194690 RepID=UPI002358DA14|nr:MULTISPECIES: CNNM domain-containing protein [unclassified Pseudoalteromonas]MDC9566711.1 CNNM domain-containing protein [Pseudoalteromonas sp. GAB2316C]MDC9570952.1 CNNM domain-containing protein [Pseudoalteromonas sp. GABNB9D]MDC9575145.1 CNNM domain-containing protein [Pseudoalteromonas sp. GABNS16A]MDC9579441.1 CNNM domain-containing protein [Pseudoalteromonas sp. GABNS16E]MDC9587177.1 CNNM domain-containing protein [Pseudoalteromonas sp. GABNS16C]